MKFAFLGLLCCPLLATAQIEDSGTELLKPFRAKLESSSKLLANPILPDLDTSTNKKLEYIVPTRLLSLDYPAPVIRPLAEPKEKAPAGYELYAKAGFGYPLSPLIEVSYHSNPSEKIKYGINFRHHSGAGNLKNQNFSKNAGNLFATYYTKSVAVGGAFGFNLDGVRFYGYHEDSTYSDTIVVPKDSVFQQFLEINGNIHAFNARVTKGDFNYWGNIGFHFIKDRYKASEFNLAPKFGIEKWIGKRQNKHAIRGELGLNLNSFKDTATTDTISGTRFMFYFKPAFHLNLGIFKAKLGTNLGVSEGKFFIFPDAELTLSLLKGQLDIFAGATGEIRLNTFRSLTRYNPFVVSAMNMRHTRWMEFYGGVRGSIRNINFDFRGGYALTQNLALFMNDSLSNYNRFQVLYDTAGIFFMRGTLDFSLVKNLKIRATVGFNNYATRTYDKAYHLPGLETNVGASYKFLFNKKDPEKLNLTLRADFFLNTGVPYYNHITDTNEILQGLFDLNLGVNFAITRNVGIFVDANNILHNRNQRWFRYRQIGFNILGGVVVKFDVAK